MQDNFQVKQIDHVELFVPERYEAAGWYEKVLGLSIVVEYEHWARASGGPLMISSDNGQTKLALFEGTPSKGIDVGGFHLTAFSVDGPGFMAFLQCSIDAPLYDEQAEPLQAIAPRDHGQAYSVYFCDPYGNRLEVTTYDAAYVRRHLEKE